MMLVLLIDGKTCRGDCQTVVEVISSYLSSSNARPRLARCDVDYFFASVLRVLIPTFQVTSKF